MTHIQLYISSSSPDWDMKWQNPSVSSTWPDFAFWTCFRLVLQRYHSRIILRSKWFTKSCNCNSSIWYGLRLPWCTQSNTLGGICRYRTVRSGDREVEEMGCLQWLCCTISAYQELTWRRIWRKQTSAKCLCCDVCALICERSSCISI